MKADFLLSLCELVVGGIANAGKVAVAIGFVVLLAISLLNSRKEATKA